MQRTFKILAFKFGLGAVIFSLFISNPFHTIRLSQMSSRVGSKAEAGVKYSLPPYLTQEELNSHKNFQRWLSRINVSLEQQAKPRHPFHQHPFKLYEINVLAANYWKGNLGFLFIEYDIHNKDGHPDSEKLPGVVFVRGNSVTMLIVLQAEEPEYADEEYVILTVQPRIAAGSLSFVELPAGSIDDDQTFAGTAAREIKEECGLEVAEDELFDLAEAALDLRKENVDESHLPKAMFPSPGCLDEFDPIFLVQKRMKREEIDRLRGKVTGVQDETEKIVLKVVKLQDLWKEAARDSKALSALALYEGLKREGKI